MNTFHIDPPVNISRLGHRSRLLFPLIATALMSACASPGKSLPRAEPVAHAEWTGVAAAAPTSMPTPTPTSWSERQWWRNFASPGLDAWVTRALAGNPSLRETAARLDAARAAAEHTRGTTQPALGLSATSLYQRYAEHAGYEAPLAGAAATTNTLDMELQVTLDFWGRNRAALQAALGDVAAHQAELEAARHLLSDEVVKAWFRLARHLERRTLARQALSVKQQRLQLVRKRVQAGLDAPNVAYLAEAQTADSAASLAGTEEDIARARHVLAELAGSGPHAADDIEPKLPDAGPGGARFADSTTTTQPPTAAMIPSTIPPTIPAALLARRADISGARARVEAAAARIAQARAAFYPNINLRAFVGLTSIGLSHWLDPGSRTYGVEPAITLPLFDGGRLRAGLTEREAEYNQAVEQYNSRVLRAAREVADALRALDAVARQRVHVADAVSAARAAHRLAFRTYELGQGDSLSVLAAETTWLEARAAELDLRTRELELHATLATALGGGFSDPAPSSSVPRADALAVSPVDPAIPARKVDRTSPGAQPTVPSVALSSSR